MNTLSYVIKKSGHDIYENIMNVVGVSLLSFIIVMPAIFFLPVSMGIFYILLTAVPAFTAALYVINKKINKRTFKFRDFFIGLKKYYLKSLILGMILALFIAIIVISWWYCIKVQTMISFVIAMFQTYFFIMICLSQVYLLPILILEDKKNFISCTKLSIKLFFDNSSYTIGMLIQIITVGLLLLVTVVSVPLLFSGLLSVFLINNYNNILLKYKSSECKVEAL